MIVRLEPDASDSEALLLAPGQCGNGYAAAALMGTARGSQ